MLDSFFLYGLIAALVLLVVFSPMIFMRLRGTSGRIMKSAKIMESDVYRAVAEKYGVEPSLVAECLTPEGETIIDAMTRCDRCGAIEECHEFFGQPGKDVDTTRGFCPNADIFIDLAEKLHRTEAR